MKLLEMINMSKSHILRVIICSIITMSILLTVSVVNRVFLYVFARWNLDIVQNSIGGSVPFIVVVTVIAWNYVVGFTIVGLCWKYLGMPKVTVIGKSYKRFMDIYYVD